MPIQTPVVADPAVHKRVFIVGFPRSGTTWVMWLLAQHPEVVAFQQSGFFHALKPFSDWWHQDHRFSARGNEADAVYEVAGSTSVISSEDFFRFLRPIGERVFQLIASQNPRTRVVVEQTPENSEFRDLVLGVFPDAYFLHVIRDPRAAYASMRSAARTWGKDFPSTPLLTAKRWKEIVLGAFDLRKLNERYLEMTYENLSRDGVTELGRMYRWLGLDADAAACRRALEACQIERLRARTKMPENFYRHGSVDAWREELPRSELHALEYLLGEEMERLGYAREHPRSHRKPFGLSCMEAVARLFARSRGSGILHGTLNKIRRWRSHLEVARSGGLPRELPQPGEMPQGDVRSRDRNLERSARSSDRIPRESKAAR